MIIAGVDEAGRGALAGPVVAAAVILDRENKDNWQTELTDSKQLTEHQRNTLYTKITQSCNHGVGIISAEIIDQIGIKPATERAMNAAVAQLTTKPDQLLIDGRDRFRFPIKSTDIIRGDETEACISAASIIAKVTRDELMKKSAEKFPEFQFERNKGYGSAPHLELIRQEIYTPIHRKTYDPLRTILTQGTLF